jgi:hypothetical protein
MNNDTTVRHHTLSSSAVPPHYQAQPARSESDLTFRLRGIDRGPKQLLVVGMHSDNV